MIVGLFNINYGNIRRESVINAIFDPYQREVGINLKASHLVQSVDTAIGTSGTVNVDCITLEKLPASIENLSLYALAALLHLPA
jgi:hypothetical protein